ncbi:hypothetical protein V3595_15975 [Bacillus sp. CFBP9009]
MERDGASAPSLSAVFFFYTNFATSASGNLMVRKDGSAGKELPRPVPCI